MTPTPAFPAVVFATLSFVVAASVQAAPPLDLNHGSVRAAIARQNSITPKALKIPGVLGTAVGLDSSGNVSVILYVDVNHPGARGLKPPPGTEIEFTEPFRAGGPKSPDGAAGPARVDHKAIQTPPIALGTSGGWRSDLANGYCCGGTIGSLIQVGGVKYILSNYHVLEGDKVSGGNNTFAVDGDPVIQPGLIDVSCQAANSQNVATLKVLNSLPNKNVDVGIAAIKPGMVNEDGSILEIGTISSATSGAFLGQLVKKSGRTSGLTRSKVSGLNAVINVSYDNECAGGPAFTAIFKGQILVAKGKSFLVSGDSGSLMVEDISTNPRAVGLLYAGSPQIAVANPIDEVLTFVGGAVGGSASMVGQ